jgi:hypothetical protein
MVSKKTTLHQAASANSLVVAELNEGEEVEYIRIEKKKDDPWIEVKTGNGDKGFVSGKSRMDVVKKIKLQSSPVVLYASTAETSEKLGEFKSGDILWLFESPKINGAQWFRVHSSEGLVGYISGKTKIKELDDNPVGGQSREIFNSAILVVLGIVLMFVKTSSSFAQWLPILGLATIVFGAVRIAYTLRKYQRAR